ncbi:NUDIX domain-containing protein [bacterium]|nr:NUDIX domain-containing protein [bacterium]
MSDNFGDKIRKIRLEHGMSQEEFAKELGYTSKSTVNKIEKGVNDMSQDKLELLFKKYDLEVDDLFDKLAEDMGTKVISEDRTERVELAVLCLIEDGNKILLQNRVKEDWRGYTLPGGHVEKGESFVDAVKREIKEETGLVIKKPKLVGVKQFPIEHGRYVVFLFKTNKFTGTLESSLEGKMEWIEYNDIKNINTVDDFEELLKVMNSRKYSEFQYIVKKNIWKVVLK